MKFDWHKLREVRAGTLVTIKEVPAILIRFYNEGNYVDVFGIVDSGADETILPGWVARKLSIEITTGELRKGVGCGGPFDFYYFDGIEVSVGGERFSIPVCFVDRDDQPPLLGLSGIFARYKIIIDAKKKTIEPKPY